MIATVIAWIGKFVSLDKLALSGCAVLVLLAGWFYVAKTNALADAASIRADNTRILDAVAAKDAAMSVLQREKAELETTIAKRNARISELNTAASKAETAIQGAKSETPSQNIDAVLPRSLSDPLRMLASTAADCDRAAGDFAASSRVSVSAETHAGTSSGDDRQKPSGVDGKDHNVGR